MKQIADSVSCEPLTGSDTGAVELRIFRVMMAYVAVAVIGSAMLAPWRVTSGLLLGGVLSLFNYHWLRSSIADIFSVGPTARPRVRVTRYVIRYFVVGVAVFTAYQLNLISLPATIVGLCSFVPALFVEAFREFYFAIFYREESF